MARSATQSATSDDHLRGVLAAAAVTTSPHQRVEDLPQIFRGTPLYLLPEMPRGSCARNFAIFRRFSAIPEVCFECYKVQVEPRTVVEAVALLLIFDALPLPANNRRKGMLEHREACPGFYKGLVYCRGLAEAHDVAARVRAAVDSRLSPQVPVFIKRGCSEFTASHPQFSHGPGVDMAYPEEWRAYEAIVDPLFRSAVMPTQRTTIQGAGLHSKEVAVLHGWLRYAASIGDDSYHRLIDERVEPWPDFSRPGFRDLTQPMPNTR